METLLTWDDVNTNLLRLGGMRPLMFSVLFGQEKVTRMLLEAGMVDPDRVNSSQCIAAYQKDPGGHGIGNYWGQYRVKRRTVKEGCNSS